MKITLQLILLFCISSLYSQTHSKTEYYRHLRYNHISPYVDISGIHPISQSTAKSTSHYIFRYDNSGKLVEIINNHYHTEKKHPLASIGAYKLKFEYKAGKEIRTFFDPNDKRISNDRGVHKEVFHYDNNQQKVKLEFYDLNDESVESNWGISEYHWSTTEDLIIEKRFNLKKELVNISPYFEFGITGIQIDKNGVAKGHFNLNEDLEVVNNSVGVASYRDTFDAQGNHTKYSYYDSNNNLTLNQWQFAIGKKSYDEIGNNILLEQFDATGTLIRSRPIYTNSSIELSPSASTKDSAEIRKKSLGYLKALQQLDPMLMDEVMNDSLNKVTIGYDRNIKKEIARATTRSQMIAFAEDWNKANNKFPPIPNDKVTILSIYDRIASVELVSDNWIEYLHLIKLNEKWEIVNLIWQHKDINRYPK